MITYKNNVDLHLVYVPSKDNPADEPSRSLSKTDSTLSPEIWKIIEHKFGPHSVDLMALDSNAMLTQDGKTLRHFTPFPTPGSSGINVFSQNVFPPFTMILPVLSFLRTRKVKICTMVVPLLHPRPVWWSFLLSHTLSSIRFRDVGDRNALLVPSKKGYIRETLIWPLEAC